MWPRTTETLLACWLAISPFVFGYAADAAMLWTVTWIAATLVAGFSLLSFIHPLRRAHLLNLIVAAGLIGFGWITAGDPPGPPQQNCILVGLLLLMTGVLPTDCVQPPEAWQAWNREHAIDPPA